MFTELWIYKQIKEKQMSFNPLNPNDLKFVKMVTDEKGEEMALFQAEGIERFSDDYKINFTEYNKKIAKKEETK